MAPTLVVLLQARDCQRLYMASKTYKNMRFFICGFITYAKKMLVRGIPRIPSGHSNTSALESPRCSMAKRSGNNSTDRYHNVPLNQNIVMARKHAKKHVNAQKMVKGNSVYEPNSIAAELSEPIGFARRVGSMMSRLKQEEAATIVLRSDPVLEEDNQCILPTNLKKPVKSMLGVYLAAKLQAKVIPEKNWVSFLRHHQVVKDLMVLALSLSMEHQSWIQG